MKWFKRTIAGSKHNEFRSEDEDERVYLFDIEVSPNGSIRLYDLRDNPATYYVGFESLRHAKKIAEQSVSDREMLKPFYDHKWYDSAAKSVKVMEDARKLLDSIK